jgi:hypothetical protein
MRVKKLWFAILVCCPIVGLGQDKIETDRPSETKNAQLIDPKIFQAELGFRKERTPDETNKYLHPTGLLKYGLSKTFELHLEAETASEHLHPLEKNTSVLYPVELGAKLKLLEEKGALPQTAIIAQVGFPFLASNKIRPPHLSPNIRLAFRNELSKKVELGYNVGAEWNGEQTTPSWLYTISPGFTIGEKWYAFVEAYGFLTNDEAPDNGLDAGVAYYISNNVRVDASAGVGLSHASPKNFIEAGVSFRLK